MEQTPRRGKRSLTRGTTSGGSSKRSRGSSASDALNRLTDLRVQSNESRARTGKIKQAKSAKACMELLKANGYTSRDPIYHMALRVFRDGFLREFFLDDCHTLEGRLYFIQSQYQDTAQYQPLPPGFGDYIQSAHAGLFLELIAWFAVLCNCIVYNHGDVHDSCF